MSKKRKHRKRHALTAPEPVRTISIAAQWEAIRTGRPAPLPEQIYARPEPMPGTLPAGMAMDSCMPSTASFTQWALSSSVFHEGLLFLGFPYLAELSQRGEYRRMAEIWAEHATRKFVKWRHPNTDRLKEFGDEMVRLKVRECFKEAAEHDGLFGRSQIFLDFGDYDRPNELTTPLVVSSGKISQRRPIQRLKVVEPMWSYPGTYVANNPLDPAFYKPSFWYVFGKTVSDTRFLTFVSREVPDMLKPSYAFGGLSLTQIAKPYVDNWLRTRQSVSDLTSAFSQMVLATDMGSTLDGGTGADLYARVDMFNQTRDNRGTMVIDKGSEELTNVQTSLASLDKLQAQSQEHLAAAARIPLSIYLQVTPTGLNASSEGEVRSFYADVKAQVQEKMFRPALERLSQIVQLSLWGAIDPLLTFEFPDLWETSELDRSTIRKNEADVDTAYVSMGALSNEDVRERLSEDEDGPYFGVSMAPSDVPDDPREADREAQAEADAQSAESEPDA